PQLPPGPFAWPIVGNIFQLGRIPHFSVTNLARTYGELMMLSIGGHHVAVASSPVAAMQILRTHDRIFSGRWASTIFVKQEAKTTDGNVPRESHLPQMAYLDACIKETIRLRPPGPFLVPDLAVQACKGMNYSIPKDSILLVNFWAIGRDPTIWKDPLTYKPERFLETKLDFKGANCCQKYKFV
ncbi:hypothetical protein RJ639_024711, partial [Escallonia herrerae]